MHIYVNNENENIDEVIAFCHDMIKMSYYPAYRSDVIGKFLEYHNAGSIRRDASQGRIWCAREDGRLVGTVTVSGGELSRMFVSPEMRRIGLGTKLALEALAGRGKPA